jgi:hypothetical protein
MGPATIPTLEAHETIAMVVRLAGVSILISTAEMLVRPSVLRDDGLMSWGVGSLRRPYLIRGVVGRVLDRLLRYPDVLALFALRGLLALAIVLGPTRIATSAWAAVAMSALLVLFAIRHPYGQDGADQMALIVFVGLVPATLCPTPAIEFAYLWFVTLQSCLAYATAGWAKAVAPGWRDGTYLVEIMATRIYGHPRLATFLSGHPALARAMARSLIVWECAFPLVLLVPPPVALGFLASGLCFHLANGYLMGLNTFFWSFFAPYPAILYCVQHRGW